MEIITPRVRRGEYCPLPQVCQAVYGNGYVRGGALQPKYKDCSTSSIPFSGTIGCTGLRCGEFIE